MSKGGSQTQTVSLDPQTQAYVNRQRQLAQGYAGLPGAPAPQVPQAITDAQNQLQNYAQGGNLGFSALTGNAGAAAQQFMNPYFSQLNPFFAQQRQQAVEGANQQATLAGAFGGDRSQIGAATAGNLVDQNQAAQQYQAFNDAMQRAGFAANLGYGAGTQAAFLPQQYAGGQLGLLNAGMGPYGQTQTTKTQNDPFSQALGLGLLAFGPGGFLAKQGLNAVQQNAMSTFSPSNFITPGGYGAFGR